VYIALVVLYVIICFFLILVVLLQQGKGADIAGAFGGGGSQTAFGARGATTFLHKLTEGAFVGFILLSMVLSILEARPKKSVIQTLPAAAATQKAPAPAPAAPAPQTAPAEGAGQPAPAQPPSGGATQPSTESPRQP
jgi:preprotein translocase subunit SecG